MLFERICKVEISPINKKQITFENDFRIAFDVTKNSDDSSISNNVSIYNLSDKSRSEIYSQISGDNDRSLEGGSIYLLSLYAGYKNSNGSSLIFRGNINSVEDKIEIPDLVTKFNCDVNSLTFKNSLITRGYDRGISAHQILKDFLTHLEVPLDPASDLGQDVKFSNGFSYAGKTHDGLKKLLKQLNLKAVSHNGQYKIFQIGKPSKEVVVQLDSESGMVRTPQKYTNQTTSMDTGESTHGWKIETLLNADLIVGRRVNIKSRTINGTFYIDSVQHAGDNKVGEFITTIIVRDIK